MDIKTEIDDEGYYRFEFKVTTQLVNFEVDIEEPYLQIYDNWQELIKVIEFGGKINMGFYQGNGEGYLDCVNDKLKFVAMPSGSGGDIRVDAEFNLEFCRAEVLRAFREIFEDERVKKFYKLILKTFVFW